MRAAVTTLLAGALSSAFAFAPMQCKHEPDPNNRLEDTAGDALWGLAQKFETAHNDAAAKETLRYLVDRYPSNRHAPEARTRLGGTAASPAPDGG